MNRNRWCTKEDVLKDLAEANGAEMQIDNSFLVVGDKPPPMRVCDADDEMKLLFGDHFDVNPKLSDNADHKPIEGGMSPDLNGITQMIRMVQHFEEEESSGIESKTCTTRPNKPYDIQISKLNPNVREFKPKKPASSPEVNTAKMDQPSGRTKNGGSDKSLKKCEPNINKFKDKLKNDAVVNGEKSNELQSVETDMQTELVQTKNSKVSIFHVKKERNVAIANLQKLLSIQSQNERVDNTAKEPTKEVKLITPDFYEHPKAVSENVILENFNTENEACDLPNISSTSSKPSSSYEVIKKLKSELKGISSDPGILKNNNSKMQSTMSDREDSIDLGLSDPQIKDSIKKVNSWLNKNSGKPSPTSPADFMNSITFKRKEHKSPNVTEKKISKPSQNTIEQYKPSEYAEELSRMYMERVKKIETQTQRSSWENLEKVLKEKDEKIKKERLKKQDGGESCSDQ